MPDQDVGALSHGALPGCAGAHRASCVPLRRAGFPALCIFLLTEKFISHMVACQPSSSRIRQDADGANQRRSQATRVRSGSHGGTEPGRREASPTPKDEDAAMRRRRRCARRLTLRRAGERHEHQRPRSPRPRPRVRTAAGSSSPPSRSLVLAGIALDTKVVRIGSEQDVAAAGFSPETFGAENFPGIKDSIARAAPSTPPTLSQAIAADKAAAAKQYGVAAGVGAVFPVKLHRRRRRGQVRHLQRRRRRPRRRDARSACRPARRSTAPTCATPPARSSSATSRTRSSTRTPAPPSTTP